MKTGEVFARNANAKTKIVVNQGGTRSSKTYSVLQLLIARAASGKYNGKVVSIVRKALPPLKRSVYRDFINIMTDMELYDERNLNKTELTYNLNGCLFEFFSTDHPQKVRGAKRDILFCNEANEISLADWVQLIIRTSERAYLDYNPSDEYHWIYDHVLTRDDVTYIQSTYKDNPELSAEQIKEIENLKKVDPMLWQVFGLGERGQNKAAIWTHWKECNEIPEGRTVIGVDFGFNNPTAIIQVTDHDKKAYVKQLVYETNLTTQDIIQHLRTLGVSKTTEIYCDAAEPDRIKEIRNAGFNAYKANKDVKKGIDTVKATELYVHRDSAETIKELRMYKWKETADGVILDDVVKLNDHACDAIRYACMALYNTKGNISVPLFQSGRM